MGGKKEFSKDLCQHHVRAYGKRVGYNASGQGSVQTGRVSVKMTA